MAVAGEIARLIVDLQLQDHGFAGKVNSIGQALGRMDTGLSRMGRGVGQVGSGLSRLGTVAAAAAAGGIGAVVATAVSFEDAFAGVRKTVDATDAQLDALQETFRQMAREIPLSFESFAALGEQAGALGIAAADIEEFARVAALLGVTTDVAADQAATSLGVLSNVLHLTGEDYDNFGATLVDLGNKGASTESQILAIAERAGAGASLIGIASDATLGWSSSIANLGIEVEAGGTALQKFFLESLRNIQDDKTLQLMAETAGTTGKAFKQAFEKDASKALQTFIVGLGKLENAERLAVLEGLGLSDIRITRALLGLAGDTDGLTASLTIANNAWRENTALQVEAEKRFKTTASQIQKLKNNVRDVAFTIGAELLPVANDLIQDFVNEINKPGTQAGIRDFARDLAAGVRGLVTELKGTDFSGIIGGMKIAAQVAKGAFDAFRSLPEPIQQLAIAALVANKVSGGAVGQIAKGLANIFLGGAGALGGLLGRGSSPANAVWVQMAGGIPGGGGGGGPGGFFPTGWRGWASLVGIAIADAFLVKTAFDEFNRQKANVEVAADFERRVVAERTDNATVAELKGLRADLKGEIEHQPADFVENALKGVFVTPELERQLKQVDQRILAETIAIQRGDAITHARLATIGLEDVHTNQLIAQANLQNLIHRGDTLATSDRAMLNTAQQWVGEQRRGTEATRATAQRVAEQRASTERGFANQAGYLNTIARKNFSPTVNVSARISNVVTVNANRVLERITEARVRTGTIPEFA